MPGIYKYVLSSAFILGLLGTGVVLAHRSFPHSPANAKRNAPPGQSGPTFTVEESDLHKPVTLIAYGDMRFTDAANTLIEMRGPRCGRLLKVFRMSDHQPLGTQRLR